MSLLPNNPRLDQDILQDRLDMEAKALRQLSEQDPKVVDQGSPGTLAPRALTNQQSLFRRLLSWGWSFVVIRRSRVNSDIALQQIDLLGQRIADASSTLVQVEARLRKLESTLDQLVDDVPAVRQEVASNRQEIMFQQRRLSRLAQESLTGKSPEAAVQITHDERLDGLYLAFEDELRGTRADIKDRQRSYVDRLTLAGAGAPDTPILDIGCGRGEWLESLGERNLTAYGIDLNRMMVERARNFGLDARHEDALDHLRGLPDACRSAVTAFHVVEHLTFEVLIDFIDEALRVLIPGGILVLETPNPETMRVGATTFYNDPTHRNPLTPRALSFMVRHRGFEEIEVLKLHPFTEGLLDGTSRNTSVLNEMLLGPQDYAVIARRT